MFWLASGTETFIHVFASNMQVSVLLIVQLHYVKLLKIYWLVSEANGGIKNECYTLQLRAKVLGKKGF